MRSLCTDDDIMDKFGSQNQLVNNDIVTSWQVVIRMA